MTQISSIYGSVIQRYDVSRKDRNSPQNRLPYCVCFNCDQRRITKRLSKKDRKKFKRKYHPICTECRNNLQELGIYSDVLNKYLRGLACT